MTAVLEEAALHVLTEDLGGDPAPVRDLIETFLKEAPLALERLRLAAERGNPGDLARHAHGLKSNSRLLGAIRVASLAEELEASALAGSLDNPRDRVGAIEAEFEGVRLILRAWAPRA